MTRVKYVVELLGLPQYPTIIGHFWVFVN